MNKDLKLFTQKSDKRVENMKTVEENGLLLPTYTLFVFTICHFKKSISKPTLIFHNLQLHSYIYYYCIITVT